MEELRKIIGENLAELRKEKKLTQLELADHFNYSDKTVSKWEKGDILPDIETLYQLCEFYGVTLDYLTHPGSKDEKSDFIKQDNARKRKNNIVSSAMMVTIVWMIFTIVYVFILMREGRSLWTLFVWGAPATSLVIVFTNILYFHKRIAYFIGFSLFVWSLIAAFYLQFLPIVNAWPLFLVGIPAEIILILWANIIPTKKKQ